MMDNSWFDLSQSNERITQKFAAKEVVSISIFGRDPFFGHVEIRVDGHLIESIDRSEQLVQFIIDDSSKYVVIAPSNFDNDVHAILARFSKLPPITDPDFEDGLASMAARALWFIEHEGYTEVRMYQYPYVSILGVPLDQPLFPSPLPTPRQPHKQRKSQTILAYLKQRPMGGLRP
jgi:hypothetical protein